MVFSSCQLLLSQVWDIYEAKRKPKELTLHWSLGPDIPSLSLFFQNLLWFVLFIKYPGFRHVHSRRNRKKCVSFIILEAEVHTVPIFKILMNKLFFRININIFERSMRSPTLKWKQYFLHWRSRSPKFILMVLISCFSMIRSMSFQVCHSDLCFHFRI